MPFGTVNLRYGVPRGETPVTCTAGVGTFIVEFGALTRLTGDPVFERVALRALQSLWNTQSELGLVSLSKIPAPMLRRKLTSLKPKFFW